MIPLVSLRGIDCLKNGVSSFYLENRFGLRPPLQDLTNVEESKSGLELRWSDKIKRVRFADPIVQEERERTEQNNCVASSSVSVREVTTLLEDDKIRHC